VSGPQEETEPATTSPSTHTLEQSFTSQLGVRPISAIEKLEQSVNQPEFLKLVGDLKESFQTEPEEFITLLHHVSEC